MQSQIMETQLYSVLFYSAPLLRCEAYNSLRLTHVQQKALQRLKAGQSAAKEHYAGQEEATTAAQQ